MVGASAPPAVEVARLTSATSSKSETGTENATVKLIGDAFVGSGWPAFCSTVTIGAVMVWSTVTVAVDADAVFPFSALSKYWVALTPATTSPDDDTGTETSNLL